MRTPASLHGHPIHPMLIVFPVALLIFSLIADFFSIFSDNTATWSAVALYTMAGGVIGALAAAVPGLIDWASLTDPHVKRIGLVHLTLNLTVVALYAVNLWLRYHGVDSTGAPMWLSVAGVALMGVSGWLGAEMVHRHGVGVEVVEANPSPAPERAEHAMPYGAELAYQPERRRGMPDRRSTPRDRY